MLLKNVTLDYTQGDNVSVALYLLGSIVNRISGSNSFQSISQVYVNECVVCTC